MITVREWLDANTEYEDALIIDAKGNTKWFWYNNDPFYDATITKVENGDNYDLMYTAILHTDMVMEEK